MSVLWPFCLVMRHSTVYPFHGPNCLICGMLCPYYEPYSLIMWHSLSVSWALLPYYLACYVRSVGPPPLLCGMLCPYCGSSYLIMRHVVSVLWTLLSYYTACCVRIMGPSPLLCGMMCPYCGPSFLIMGDYLALLPEYESFSICIMGPPP